MKWARAGLLGAVAATVLLSWGGRADAAGKGKGKEGKGADAQAQEVRVYLDKAGAAYALGRYAVAAENYEKAFELKTDPSVLYNAAQAHRLAGNKERALDLYQGYARMYGTDMHADVEKHIEALKQAIEKERAPTSAPVEKSTPGPEPATPRPEPRPSPPAVAAAPPPAPKPVESTPVLVTQASPHPASDEGSVLTKPWFWIVVGGAVAAAVVAGLLLSRREPSDPVGTLPMGMGN